MTAAPAAPRIIGVADSDSFIKWGAAMLGRLPAPWQRSLLLLRTPARPSARQLAAALVGTPFSPAEVEELAVDALAERIAHEQPDAVLLAVRGPVVRVLVRAITARMPQRPVFLSGMPGITIPMNVKAIHYRSPCDLVLLHSHREREEFTAAAEQLGIRPFFALATLPFLPERDPEAGFGCDIVFAAQAIVPREPADRRILVGWLAETARRNPAYRLVLKVRALAREQQTHSERHPLPGFLDALPEVPENLVLGSGPMSEHLDRAAALVTVSSTAALEAIARGVPVLLLDDFGVGRELINTVFEGSGLFGSVDDLAAARFHHPDPGWMQQNYFHPAAHDDWQQQLEVLVLHRASEGLPERPPTAGTLGGAVRRAWDRQRALGEEDRSLAGRLVPLIGVPARGALRLWRRVNRRPASVALRYRPLVEAAPEGYSENDTHPHHSRGH